MPNKTLHEILALEFTKNINDFSLSSKASILYTLAKADVEASSILKTLHAIVASNLEASSILVRGQDLDSIVSALISEQADIYEISESELAGVYT